MEKIALVTGSSRGIGRAVAAELARQGWAVCINYRVRENCARSLLEQLTAEGRIKTFDDAFKELGENHPLVKEYHKRHLFLEDDSDISSDLVAYLKLRIITAALNEGWTPQFTKDEYRYYPWFWLYTKEEIAKMNKEERKKVVLFGGFAAYGSSAGFAYAYSSDAPSHASAHFGSRLCFKSSALAKYAGEQFAEIYFAFVGK